MTDRKLPPLARNIRDIRRFRGLTQADLAEISRLSPKTIYSIEHGEHEPTMATIKALARALNMSPRTLLTDPDAVSSTTKWLNALRKLFRGDSAAFRKAVTELVHRLSHASQTTTKVMR
jgi:transcriptional regulator with XRE-family HTH domain